MYFQLIHNRVEVFKNDLEKLQSDVKSSADFVGYVCLSQKEKEERAEAIKVRNDQSYWVSDEASNKIWVTNGFNVQKHLLELRELAADIERLNEETFTLPLDDRTLSLLQNLNRSWEKSGEMALEDCRWVLYGYISVLCVTWNCWRRTFFGLLLLICWVCETTNPPY